MTISLNPETATELAEAVRSAPRIVAVGAGTKPRFAWVDSGYVRISTARLSGVIEYEPSEFTFTALAGTPVRDICSVLAEHNQYLPFDPMLIHAGATIGGTIAAGMSGPGRVRFGGLRDFVLGIRFVDGEGRLLRMGGKVVKNAAGFDLPKLFVGSAGRLGILAEVTIKVFPRPKSALTLRLPVADAAAMTRVLMEAAKGRWEFDALDAPVSDRTVFARLAGPPAATDALANDVLGRWSGRKLSPDEATRLWNSVSEFQWAHRGGSLVKIALNLEKLPGFSALLKALPTARAWISGAGNVAFISLPAIESFDALDDGLRALSLAAVTLRGDWPLWLGVRTSFPAEHAVKRRSIPTDVFLRLETDHAPRHQTRTARTTRRSDGSRRAKLRALRLLPRRLSDVSPTRAGDGYAARADRIDEADA